MITTVVSANVKCGSKWKQWRGWPALDAAAWGFIAGRYWATQKTFAYMAIALSIVGISNSISKASGTHAAAGEATELNEPEKWKPE